MINSSTRPRFRKPQFIVPPPSNRIFFIRFLCKIFKSLSISTDVFPHLITSNGNFSNLRRFFLEIRLVVATIVGILLQD